MPSYIQRDALFHDGCHDKMGRSKLRGRHSLPGWSGEFGSNMIALSRFHLKRASTSALNLAALAVYLKRKIGLVWRVGVQLRAIWM